MLFYNYADMNCPRERYSLPSVRTTLHWRKERNPRSITQSTHGPEGLAGWARTDEFFEERGGTTVCDVNQDAVTLFTRSSAAS